MKNNKALSLLIMLIMIFAMSVTAFASDGNAIRKNISSYDLDLEELGITDMIPAGLNGAANALFQLSGNVAETTCDVYDWSNKFTINDLFEDGGLTEIAKEGKKGIFDNAVIMVVAFLGVCLIPMVFKRNFMGIFGVLFQAIVIMVLAAGIASNAGQITDTVNGITNEISNAVVISVGSNNNENLTVSDKLWKNLIHEPWLEMEFMGATDLKSNADDLLSLQPGSDDRKEKVAILVEEGAFNKNTAGSRLGYSLLSLVLIIVKSVIFLALACMNIFFKIIFAFLIIIAPIIFLMAIVPAFGGMNVVYSWLKKNLEIQLYIVLTSLIVGVLLIFDSYCMNLSKELGWLGAGILQIAISAMIIVFREKIFALVEVTGARMTSGNAGAAMNNVGHGWARGEKNLENQTRKQVANMTSGEFSEGVKGFGNSVAIASKSVSMGALATARQSQTFNYAEDKARTMAHIATTEINDRIGNVKSAMNEKKASLSREKEQRQLDFNDRADKTIIVANPVLAQKLHIGQTIEDYDEKRREKETVSLYENKNNLPDYENLPPPMEQISPMNSADADKMLKHQQQTRRTKIEGEKSYVATFNKPVDLENKQRNKERYIASAPQMQLAQVQQGENNVVNFPRERIPKAIRPVSSPNMYTPSGTDDIVTPMKVMATGMQRPLPTSHINEIRPKLDLANINTKTNNRTERKISKRSKSLGSKNRVRGETVANKQAQLSTKRASTL